MAEAIVREGYVQMVAPDGQPREVPLESLQQAYASGYAPEAPEAVAARERQAAAETAPQQVLTFAEGAASSLTFGLSDHALVSALGDEYREGAQARAEYNPTARAAGEVTGAVAPAVFSGGGSLAARAVLSPGRAIARAGVAAERIGGKSIAGRALGGAAGGAIEGAAFGAGRANADAALGGTAVTAEKLLSAAGEGAMWGAVGGGVVAGGAAAAGKAGNYVAAKMTGGSTMREALSDFVAGRALKSVASEGLPVSAERATRLGQKILDANVPTYSPAKASEAIKAATQKADDVAARVAKLADDAGVRPDLKTVFARADEATEKLRSVPTDEFKSAARRMDRELKPLREAVDEGREFSASELWQVRKSLGSGKVKGPAGDAVDEVRRSLDEAISESFDQVSDDALHAAAGAGDEAAAALVRDKRAVKDAWRQAASDADDWALIARAAAKETPDIKARLMAAGQESVLGMLTGIATGSFGAGAAVAMLGSKIGTAARDYALQRGVSGVMRVADRLARVERRVEGAAAAIATGADRSASAVGEGTTGGVLAAGMYRLLQSQIEDAGDPAKMAERIAPIAADHPELALAVQESLRGDAEYIRARLPMPSPVPAAGLQPQLDANEALSPLDQRRLAAIATALNDPASVAEDLSRGYYDPDAVEAAKTRRPEMWADIRARVLYHAAAQKEPIPFAQRNLIGQAFDVPAADWSLQPDNLAGIQALAEPMPAEDSPGGSQRANIDPSLAEAYAPPRNPIDRL